VREAPLSDTPVTLVVDGRTVTAPPGRSIIEAVWAAGHTLVEHVGCLGQGVCGSCRAMVRRDGSPELRFVLACETLAEPGMLVSFVHALAPRRERPYQIGRFHDLWGVGAQVRATFPEAAHCRHCGGCDAVCPRGLSVQAGVGAVVGGQLHAAGAIFEACIMCNLCTAACPEQITPNHVGLFARRLAATLVSRPANLLRRLEQLERGELRVVIDGSHAKEGAHG
jgi:succinate dehydrogenase/fumarate reductase-like Fe-S protein